MEKHPVVSIVGRPNVGKSTLFNRIVGSRKALVDHSPGVTRDRIAATCSIEDKVFTLVDTGGMEIAAKEGLQALLKEQIERAVADSALIIFVVDSRAGLMPDDKEMASKLRSAGKPLILAVNKVESPKAELAAAEFHALGFRVMIGVSAEHGRGMADLLDGIYEELPLPTGEEAGGDFIKVAIVGRPNTGKSSLTNRVLGEERVLVSPEAGTTRDPVDIRFTRDGTCYELVDTRGLRRKRNIRKKLDYVSDLKTRRVIEGSEVAVLMIDAVEGITHQDVRIASYAKEKGAGVLVAFNKWDLIENPMEREKEIRGQFALKMSFLSYAPLVFISSVTGDGISGVFPLIERIVGNRKRRIPTPALNDVLGKATSRLSPQTRVKRDYKLKYIVQTGVSPPSFTIFTNLDAVPRPAYVKYLENSLRERFDFSGTPLYLSFKKN